MKKLLVFMLVLGLAAGANAALSLSVNGSPAPDEYTMNVCEYIVIDITSTTADTYMAAIGFDEVGLCEWKNPAGGDPWRIHHDPGGEAGGGAMVMDLSGMGYPNYWGVMASGSPEPLVTPGEHFQFDFHCKALGDVTIWLVETTPPYRMIDRMVIHQIPEPVSMVLLGLGGLLLRRRR